MDNKIIINEINFVNKLIKWKAFIAWWCCRSILEWNQPKDLDIFLYNENDYNNVVNILKDNLEEIETNIFNIKNSSDESNVVWENDLVKNFKTKSWMLIQLVKPRIQEYMRSWWTEEEVVWTFDFSVCRFWLEQYDEKYDNDIKDFNDFEIDYPSQDYNEEFDTSNFNDVENKLLFVYNIVCPIATIRRALKYAWYWYYMPIQELLKLLKEVENRKMPLNELMKTSKEDLYSLMQSFD